ncbi:uncharacterized protein LOC62_02G003403 [Vanrija pseudolonga]|uniref:Uncharacterized protein n=1 Tax=Vanrija pseudolonga TaxID=143232 RepID=A0AAF1BJI1_9TREE|nr:hypothetical protein LOC62_02G003403 [Vanrija pseudolonga]
MEWLSKTCNKAWSSGTLDFTSAQETKKAQYDLLKRHMGLAVRGCLADSLVMSDPQLATFLRFVEQWDLADHAYTELEDARLRRIYNDFTCEVNHFLQRRGGAARLMARQIRGYYSLDENVDIVTPGLDAEAVLKELAASTEAEIRRLSPPATLPAEALADPIPLPASARQCITHANVVIDAVSKADSEGLLHRGRLFPSAGLVGAPTHAQVKYEVTEFYRLKEGKDGAVLGFVGQERSNGVHSSLAGLAAWRKCNRRGGGKPAVRRTSADSAGSSAGSEVDTSFVSSVASSADSDGETA